MNKIKFFAIALLVLNLVSCNVEPLDPTIIIDDNTDPSDFTALIGADDFSADDVSASYSQSAQGPQLNISGVTSTGKTISIQMVNPVFGTRSANTIPSTLLKFTYLASLNDAYSSLNATTNASSGTITITQFNLSTNKISGTFSFTGYGALDSTILKQITEGTFTNISFVNTVTDDVPNTIPGSYLLTAFNTSVPTDLNGDGVNSTNQLSETTCFNNAFITLNANFSFTADTKGIEININGTQIDCFEDPDIAGSWSVVGNQLTLTYIESGVPETEVFTISGSTLSLTIPDGEVVGTASGNPIYLTSDITFVYTKQ